MENKKDVVMSDAQRPVAYINRVLVVEDDYQLASLLVEVLDYENCISDVATNGMDALDQLRSGDYEAVICDLMMPLLDGEMLYSEAVKSYPYLSNKFLFITGNSARVGGLTGFIQRTGNSILEKPFEIDELRVALKELFSRWR